MHYFFLATDAVESCKNMAQNQRATRSTRSILSVRFPAPAWSELLNHFAPLRAHKPVCWSCTHRAHDSLNTVVNFPQARTCRRQFGMHTAGRIDAGGIYSQVIQSFYGSIVMASCHAPDDDARFIPPKDVEFFNQSLYASQSIWSLVYNPFFIRRLVDCVRNISHE